jgi:hypothetical protein
MNASFWEARWLNGVSPKDLAPNLFKQARFKFRTVQKELNNMNWISNLKQVNTDDLLDEFVLLFTTLSEVQLNNDHVAILWKWTSSGEYTTTSAYKAQFLGAYPEFRATSIWRAFCEPKCCFFAWLALLGKVPTADNLAKKNWPCNLSCALCFCLPEMNGHMLTECNFTEAVWDRITLDLQVHATVVSFQKGTVADWIASIARIPSKHQQRINAGIIFFFLVVYLEGEKA